MTDIQKPQYPGLPRRLVAIIYDTCLVLPLVMVLVAIAFAMRAAVIDLPASDQMETPLLNPYLVQAIEFFAVISFFCYEFIVQYFVADQRKILLMGKFFTVKIQTWL